MAQTLKCWGKCRTSRRRHMLHITNSMAPSLAFLKLSRSNQLNFLMFADDTNLRYADKNLRTLEVTVNKELASVCNWLMTTKLSS